MNILPVLNFHGFQRGSEFSYEDVEMPYVLEENVFTQIIERVTSGGFESLKATQIPEWRAGRTFAKAVLLTFDDGLVSHRMAGDHLKASGLSGVFFVSAGLVGKKGYLAWSDLNDLIHDGHEIGSHGFSHVPLIGLDEFDRNHEIRDSKRLLEDRLGIPVSSFSIPRGFATPAIYHQIIQSGYELIFSSRFDINSPTDNSEILNRLAIKRHHSIETIIAWLHGDLGFKKHFEYLKEFSRRFLPVKMYDAMADAKRGMS